MKKILFLFVACVMLIVGTSCERIDAGCEGIKVNLFGSDRGVDDVALVTGWVYFNPVTQKVFEYPTYIRAMECDTFIVNAKDGGEFIFDPKINIKIKEGETPKVFRRYRKAFDDVIGGPIFLHLINACRIEINNFTTDSIVSNREKVEKAIEKRFEDAIKTEGFQLCQFTTGLKYPPSIAEAVEAKNKIVQQAQQKENEIRVAEAEAKKKLIYAEADRKANELRTQGLSPAVLKAMFYEKWDGIMPKVILGDKGNSLLNITP